MWETVKSRFHLEDYDCASAATSNVLNLENAIRSHCRQNVMCHYLVCRQGLNSGDWKATMRFSTSCIVGHWKGLVVISSVKMSTRNAVCMDGPQRQHNSCNIFPHDHKSAQIALYSYPARTSSAMYSSILTISRHLLVVPSRKDRDAEVNNWKMATIWRNEHVCRFDVSVCNAMPVHECHPLDQLCGSRPHVFVGLSKSSKVSSTWQHVHNEPARAVCPDLHAGDHMVVGSFNSC